VPHVRGSCEPVPEVIPIGKRPNTQLIIDQIQHHDIQLLQVLPTSSDNSIIGGAPGAVCPVLFILKELDPNIAV
jgi:hypothetical protein